MKKHTKLIALLLALAMLAAAAAGCSQDAGDTSTSPAASDNTPSGTSPGNSPGASVPDDGPSSLYPVTDEIITLELYQAVGGFLLPYLNEDGWNAYSTFQRAEEVTNVHIEWYPIEQDLYGEKFNIMLSGGDYADIVAQPDKHYQGGADALVADDICIDLSPYLDSYAPDFMAKVYNQYETYAKQITTDSGNIVILCTIGGDHVGSGPIIRMDWVEKLNMETPRTYDQLHDVLLAFKTELNVQHPMVIQSNMSYGDNVFSSGMDVGLWNLGDLTWQVDDSGTVIATCMTPQYKEYLQMLNGWYNEGLLTDASLTFINARYFDETIQADQTGFWGGGTNTLGNDFAAVSGDPDFNAYPIPEIVQNVGDTLHMGSLPHQLNDASGFAITTQCEYPEAALSWINWFFTDEGSDRFNFGEEDVTYTVSADGTKQYTELITNNPDIPSMITINIYTGFPGGQPAMSTTERALMSYVNDAQKATIEAWSTVQKDNKHMYYGSLTAEESEIYSSRAGDMFTLVSENMTQFIYGNKSFDEYDDFLATIESLNLAALTEVKQAAYDRFMSR